MRTAIKNNQNTKQKNTLPPLDLMDKWLEHSQR